MKLLVIGIDGGTKKIVEGMLMPFTQSLIKDASSIELKEDLISRGWAETLTGHHAATNKGFYLMPCSDKSYDFSGAYSKSDMLTASKNKPLWDMLNDKGCSVGIVNVPTTGPADKVNGFIVAGGGGGIKATGGIPDGMVYPQELKKELADNNYVFDVRLPGGEKTVSGFLKKIGEAENIQKNTFIEFSKKLKPDFGFHCFRITTEVQYLARFEIEKCIEKIAESEKAGKKFKPESTVQESIVEHYKKLDENIKEIFAELKPEHFILVSDHSTAIFKNEGNLDVWLNKKGYLSKLTDFEVFVKRVNGLMSRKLNKIRNIKPVVKASLIRRPITRFSKKRTKAFGTFYDTGNFAGIFINDQLRFDGPVKDEKEVNVLVEKICSEFNSDPVARHYSLDAKPYRQLYKNDQFQSLMPDIKIHKPDSIYFSSRKWDFVIDNPNLKPMNENITGIKYPHTGAKGSDPLFFFSKGLEKFVEQEDPSDLRIFYNIISRFFDHQKSDLT